MKKVLLLIAAAVLFVSVLSSCKSHALCPAYANKDNSIKLKSTGLPTSHSM